MRSCYKVGMVGEAQIVICTCSESQLNSAEKRSHHLPIIVLAGSHKEHVRTWHILTEVESLFVLAINTCADKSAP